MVDRLKELRKELELSQAAFGEKIGVKQSTIGDIESGKNKLSDRNIAAICRVFNVNEEWLRNGEGEMFKKPQDGLAKLQEEYDLNDGDMAIIKSFLELPPEMRQMVLEFGKNLARNMAEQWGIEPPNFDRPPDDKLTVAQKRRIMNEELDAEEKRQISSPSTSTSGSSKKIKNFS